MGAMMPDGFPMMFSSPPRRRREDAERGTGNGAHRQRRENKILPPPPPHINNNNNNNNNNSNRRNSRTNPAQTLATYAMRLDRHLAASQQQQQEQQNQQEDEHLESVVHHGVCCDACGVMPIRGARYKCTNRDDYDLCSECHSRLYGGVDRVRMQFHRLAYPLPIGLMDGREISLFGRLGIRFRRFRPRSCPVFTHETTTNAVPGAASDNANANTFKRISARARRRRRVDNRPRCCIEICTHVLSRSSRS